MTAECGEEYHSCRCTLSLHHDDRHECPCEGSWLDGVPVTFPRGVCDAELDDYLRGIYSIFSPDVEDV